MDKYEAIDKLLQEQELKNVIFNKSLSSSSLARSAMKMLNYEIQEDPKIRSTAIALSTYMPMKWALQHPIASDLFAASGVHDISEMIDVHRILQRVLGNELNKELIDTSYHIRQCENIKKITELVEQGAEDLARLPSFMGGYYMHRCIEVIHLNPEAGKEDDIGRYVLKNYYIKACREIRDCFGYKFDYYYSRSLYPKQSISKECKELYHNTDVLMTCYFKILSKFQREEYIYRQVLKCKTFEEIMAYDRFYSDYEGAETLLQYMILIRNAIEQVKYYPKSGELYYNILMADIDNKVRDTPLTVNLKKLHLSKGSYYTKKNEAYDVLSLVLWGYSTRSMIGILEKSD